ncbi:tail assembly chaperone [Gordonia phage Camerico]|nr:tail assembly chaperone [Gordonia phage Camerico]
MTQAQHPGAPGNVHDPLSFDYERDAEEVRVDQSARDAGFKTETPIFVDFWGKERLERFYFPGQESLPEDYKQYIEFKPMNEGARARYQKATNRGIVVEKKTQDMRMGVDAAGDRRALFEESIVDWRFAQNGALIPFSTHKFRDWLEKADPYIVDELERAIRKQNKWMISEMSSEQIREEINTLEEQWKEAKLREESEEDFSSKRASS